MAKTKLISISVRKLPKSTKPHHVRDFFQQVDPQCNVVVAPLVNEYSVGGKTLHSKCSTVTMKVKVPLNRSTRTVVEEMLHRFENRMFRVGLEESRIALDVDFNGITPLYEHPMGAKADVYLIHGLGGHAFSTWSNKVEDSDPESLLNWARDFLWEDLEQNGIRARVVTLGYNANVVRRVDVTADISTIAQGMLQDIKRDRDFTFDRPMFFVCHSLGGLVLCQALILALYEDRVYGVETGDVYKRLLLDGNECRVKGVLFMGTPFDGSLVADAVQPLAAALEAVNPFKMNTGLIDALVYGGDNLHDIVGKFRSVLEKYEIPILIGCETRTMRGSLVTTRDSATSVFGRYAPIATMRDVDHAGLVRFDSRDQNYQTLVGSLIVFMREALSTSSPTRGNTIDDSGHRPDQLRGARSRSSEDQPGNTNTIAGGIQSGNNTVNVNIDFGQILARAGTDIGRYFGSPTLSQGPGSGRTLIAEDNSVDVKGDHTKYSALERFDTKFIIDDTSSMTVPADSRKAAEAGVDHKKLPSRWAALEKVVESLVAIAVSTDADGIDVQFLKCTELGGADITSSQDVLKRLEAVRKHIGTRRTEGGTFFYTELCNALYPSVMRFKEYITKRDSVTQETSGRLVPPKGLNLIVFTDGEADDHDDVEHVLVDVAQKLDEMNAPPTFIGVQFVQVGDDPAASEWLQYLDEGLKVRQASAPKPFRDIVDFTLWDPKQRDKAIMGGVVRKYERMLSKLPESESTTNSGHAFESAPSTSSPRPLHASPTSLSNSLLSELPDRTFRDSN